jgi:hypothetical protein
VEFAVLVSGSVPAKEFLEEELNDAARAKFLVLFQQMADYGRVSPKRFKSEMKKLCAFRHEIGNRQIRFPCFRDEQSWILTHGFFKPGAKNGLGKWPQSEIDRAERIMDDYWQRKEDEA